VACVILGVAALAAPEYRALLKAQALPSTESALPELSLASESCSFESCAPLTNVPMGLAGTLWASSPIPSAVSWLALAASSLAAARWLAAFVPPLSPVLLDFGAVHVSTMLAVAGLLAAGLDGCASVAPAAVVALGAGVTSGLDFVSSAAVTSGEAVAAEVADVSGWASG
jgi:hypothetical protein